MHIGIPQRVHKGGVQRLEEQIGQGQAEDIADAVEPGEHPAQEQERRHVKGVDHRVEELPVWEPLRQLQQVPQHHQCDQQKAERIILIFPRPRIRFHLLHPLIRKPPDPAGSGGFLFVLRFRQLRAAPLHSGEADACRAAASRAARVRESSFFTADSSPGSDVLWTKPAGKGSLKWW